MLFAVAVDANASLLLGLDVVGGRLRPPFDADTSHYAMKCDPASSYGFRLSTDANVSVNGYPAAASFTMTNLGSEDDIVIELRDNGNTGNYVVHCIPDQFPRIEVDAGPEAEDGLIVLAGRTNDLFSYLALVDHQGVPRFHKAYATRRLWHFKPLKNSKYAYTVGSTEDLHWTILTSRLTIDQSRLTTGPSLAITGGHDLLVKDNGNFVLMAYEPATRDFSAFQNEHGTSYSITENTRDSIIQEVTPEGVEVMTWNSWDHLALEDCRQHRFPDDYAHVNSLFLTEDGDLLASFRGCSQVALIDWQAEDGTPGEGNLLWLLGKSNKTDWAVPRLTVENDPYGEFCGQHAASITSNGNLLLFDNGGFCQEDAMGATVRTNAVFSRAVEYRLDVSAGTATFVRHVSQHGAFNRYARAAGAVSELDNGNWLISWGRGFWDDDPATPLPHDAVLSEVDPATGVTVMNVKVTSGSDPEQLPSFGAYKVKVEPPLRAGARPILPSEPSTGGGGGGGGGGSQAEDDGDDDDLGGGGGGGGGSQAEDDGHDDDDGGDSGGGGSGGGPPRAAIEVDADCVGSYCRARAGARLSFRDASSGTVGSRLWDFGDGTRSRSASFGHAWSSPGFFEVTLTVSDGAVESSASLTFLVEAALPAGTCVADDLTRCLGASRYAVTVDWWTAGRAGAGQGVVVREGSDDSGLFQFFGASNWEVLIKVLDGCAVNGRVWVFGASTTDLGYLIRVTDTATGATKEYRNEPGQPAPAITDVAAFPDACQP